MAHVNNTVPHSDVYVVRDMAEAKKFLKEAGYDRVFFSALDMNKSLIKDLAADYGGKTIVGGYVPMGEFSDVKNITTYDSIEKMTKGENIEYKPGMDYGHFQEAEVIPRLCMSKGCYHSCAFCTIPKEVVATDDEAIDQQVEAMAALNTKFVYLDDKTFGQAESYKKLPEINRKMKQLNPDFEGFIIQTTAHQMNKFTDEFLAESGIKQVELGIETYNDPILKKLHKPATEKLIDRAVDRMREHGIEFIPNIIIGFPGETAATYQNTLDFLERNRDVISHININNLALYAGTELTELLGAKAAVDVDQNVLNKSFHKDPKIHEDFAEKAYAMAETFLDDPTTGEDVTADQAIGQQYGLTPEQTNQKLEDAENRYRQLKQKPADERTKAEGDELKFLRRNRTNVEALLEKETEPEPPPVNKRRRPELLALGHKIPKELGLSESDRRDMIESMFKGHRSLKKLKIDQLRQFVEMLEDFAGTETEITEEDMHKPIQVGDRTTNMKTIMDEAGVDVTNLDKRKKIPKVVKKGYAAKAKGGMLSGFKKFFFTIHNTPVFHLARILGDTFSDVLGTNIQRGRKIATGHAKAVYDTIQAEFENLGITPSNLANMSKSLNPRFQWIQKLIDAANIDTGTELMEVTIQGQPFQLTYGNLIDIFLIANQEDGMRHLNGGGLVIEGVETGPLSNDDIQHLVGMLETNPKARAIADIFLKVGEQIWTPSINQTSQNTEGKDIAVLEKWWGLEVKYPQQLAGKGEKFEVNILENKSIFHDRTRSEAPLVVRDAFDRFAVFEAAISEYVGMAEPTRIARTLINNSDLNREIDRKGYTDVMDNIREIMKRDQSTPPKSGPFEKFISKVLPGIYRSVLFFNPRVVMSQFTSATNYAAYISPKYMKHTLDGLSPKMARQTLDMSSIAWDRFHMGHTNIELGELGRSDATLRAFSGKGKAADINKMGWMLRAADLAALGSGMSIAMQEYVDAQKGTITGESAEWWSGKDASHEVESEEWRQAVTDRAEFLWQRTQPSWDKWNRSMITSDPGLAKKIFFLFRSFHEKSLTILNDANLEYSNSDHMVKDRMRQAKKYGAVMAGYTLNTALRAAIMAGLTRQLDEPLEYLMDLVRAPYNMIPILGKILQTTIPNFVYTLAEHRAEYRGEAIESFPIKVINTIAKAPDNFARSAAYYLMGEEEKGYESLKKAVGQVYEGVGTAEGIPVNEIKRLYKGWIEGEEPSGSNKSLGKEYR
jgi:tRNA A37 methylthiotransferase MiaB